MGWTGGQERPFPRPFSAYGIRVGDISAGGAFCFACRAFGSTGGLARVALGSPVMLFGMMETANQILQVLFEVLFVHVSPPEIHYRTRSARPDRKS
jgi:hypothetical protein